MHEMYMWRMESDEAAMCTQAWFACMAKTPYGSSMFPSIIIGDIISWPTVEGMVIVMTPIYSRGARYPMTTRMQSQREPPRTRRAIARCSNCGVIGHNHKSCRQPKYSNVLFVKFCYFKIFSCECFSIVCSYN